MLKRIILFAFLLSALSLIALAPMDTNPAPKNNAKLQTTVVVTVVVAPPATPGSSIPVTGGDMPASTLIIIGLLVVLGIGVVVGGAALMSRREL